MFDIKKRQVLYDDYTYTQKINKLLSMLEMLREEGNIFDQLYLILSEKELDEEYLHEIHNTLLNAMYQIDVKGIEDSMEKLEKSKENIENIKKMEDNEQKQNDPEKILKNL